MRGFQVKEKRYQIRRAAGLYWLLDMEQDANPYREPVPLNETGAKLFAALEEGKTKEGLVDMLVREYELPPDEARTDTEAFLKQLSDFGYTVEDC